MHKRIIWIVICGLAWHGATAAAAGPVRRPNAAANSARDRLRLYRLLGTPGAHDERLAALQEHHVHTTRGSSPLVLHGDGRRKLVLGSGQDLRIQGEKGPAQPVSIEALASLGIRSGEDFDRIVDRRLIASATRDHVAPADSTQAVEVLRKETEQVSQLHAGLRYHPTVELLKRYGSALEARKVADAGWFPTSKGFLAVDGTSLQIGDSLIDHPRALTRFGIHSKEQLESFLGEAVLRAAGMGRAAPTAKNVATATARIEEELRGHQQLEEIVHDAEAHPDLVLLKQVQATRALRKEAALQLVIAREGGASLELAQRAGGSGYQLVVVQGHGAPQGVTVATLERFGVGTKAKFDRAIERMMEEIAPEDLF